MLAFVQQFKKAIPVCKSVDHKQFTWGQIDEISIAMFDASEGHIKIPAEEVQFNQIPIQKEIDLLLEEFSGAKFYDFGFTLGQTLTSTLEPADD